MKKKKQSVDPFQEYLDKHPEVFKQYKNKHVAIHPEKGIVASGDTLKEVLEKVEELNLKDAVLIDKFNNLPFIGMGAYIFSE